MPSGDARRHAWSFAPGTAAIDERGDPRAHAILSAVAAAGSLDARIGAADAALRAAVAERPPTREGLVANAASAAMSDAVRARTAGVLAGRSDRTVQRALAATVGMGPKAVARRIRLQEAARLLAEPGATPSAVAAELGYADQAHLTNDLRSVAGVTPAAYVRSLRRLADGSVSARGAATAARGG